MTSFNLLDLAFIGFGLIFMIIAFFRGFIKEIFALINWLVAISLAFLLPPLHTKLFFLHFHNNLITNFSSKIVIFILVFIIVGIVTAKLSDNLKKSLPSSIDQSLGVVYGLVKNLLIFGILYSITNNFYLHTSKSINKKISTNQEKQYLPIWLTGAKSYKIIKSCGELIDPITKNLINNSIKNVEVELNSSNPKLNDSNQKSDQEVKEQSDFKTSNSKSGHDLGSGDIGYSKKEIEKMDRLIDVIAK